MFLFLRYVDTLDDWLCLSAHLRLLQVSTPLCPLLHIFFGIPSGLHSV